MNERSRFFIESLEFEFITLGLKPFIGKEVRLKKGKFKEDDYRHVLQYIGDYIISEHVQIEDGHLIAYCSWLLKFVAEETSQYFDVFEVELSGEDYISGSEYSIGILQDQVEFCQKYNVSPVFPSFSQKIAISKGVLDGRDVQAVRYPAPDHMTGWYLTTDLYNGDVDTLSVIYYYEVAFARPELIKALALPFGFRFGTNQNDADVWYDEEVLVE